MSESILQPYSKIHIEGDQVFIMADLSIPKKAVSTLLYKAADLFEAGELQEHQISNFMVEGLKPFMQGFSSEQLAAHYLRIFVTQMLKEAGLNL